MRRRASRWGVCVRRRVRCVVVGVVVVRRRVRGLRGGEGGSVGLEGGEEGDGLVEDMLVLWLGEHWMVVRGLEVECGLECRGEV